MSSEQVQELLKRADLTPSLALEGDGKRRGKEFGGARQNVLTAREKKTKQNKQANKEKEAGPARRGGSDVWESLVKADR